MSAEPKTNSAATLAGVYGPPDPRQGPWGLPPWVLVVLFLLTGLGGPTAVGSLFRSDSAEVERRVAVAVDQRITTLRDELSQRDRERAELAKQRHEDLRQELRQLRTEVATMQREVRKVAELEEELRLIREPGRRLA